MKKSVKLLAKIYIRSQVGPEREEIITTNIVFLQNMIFYIPIFIT